MLKGLDNQATIEFISTTDKENPTIFLLGNISNNQKLQLFADAIDSTGKIDMTKMSSRIFDIAKAGLKGIKNLNGVDYTTVDDAVLEAIPFNVAMEVVNKLIEINFLSEQEKKV
jgi:hypothetical protein